MHSPCPISTSAGRFPWFDSDVKHESHPIMQTVTIRELRQNWPKIEARLRTARQPLLVTRDGEPVAQMSPPPRPAGEAKAFDAAGHQRWLRRIWGAKAPATDSSAWLSRERAERNP